MTENIIKPFVPNDAWGKLSMREKTEMTKLTMKNGITSLKEIRQRYNEFAEGGEIEEEKNLYPFGGGLMPISAPVAIKEGVKEIRQRLYDNVSPFAYHYPVERIASAVLFDEPSEKQEYEGNRDILDDLWGTYLDIPKDKRHYDPVLTKSKYRPTKAKDENAKYYSIPYHKDDKDYIIKEALLGNKQLLNPELGTFTVDVGKDDKGQYVSYYDNWNINPFKGITNVGNKVTDSLGLNKVEDLSLGLGKPIEIYDRIYLDDYYGVPDGGNYLPEVIVMPKKEYKKVNAGDAKAFGGPIVEQANLYGLGDWLRRGRDWFSESNKVAAVAENSSVMTAAGWSVSPQDQASQNSFNTSERNKLADNLATIGEWAVMAPTAAKDIEGLYQVFRHPIQTAKAVTGAIRQGAKAIGKKVKAPVEEWMINRANNPRSFEDIMRGVWESDASLPEAEELAISKYANSQKNAVKQLNDRMSDPDYAAMIRDNSNPNFRIESNPIYIEGKDRKNAKEMQDFFMQKVSEITDDPMAQLDFYVNISNVLHNNQAMALPHTPYAYVPKKERLLSGPYITKGATNAAKQHQYSILKAHEGSHIFSHPKEESPLHQYLSGFDGRYLGAQKDAELSARGTQLKNYFDKKAISDKELKYAANHYVEDTGIDNNMTNMFDQLKNAAKKDPDIWKKQAAWISSVSPVLGIGLFNQQYTDRNK